VEMVQISKDLEVFDAELVALSQMTCLLHKTKLIQLKRSIDNSSVQCSNIVTVLYNRYIMSLVSLVQD